MKFQVKSIRRNSENFLNAPVCAGSRAGSRLKSVENELEAGYKHPLRGHDVGQKRNACNQDGK